MGSNWVATPWEKFCARWTLRLLGWCPVHFRRRAPSRKWYFVTFCPVCLRERRQRKANRKAHRILRAIGALKRKPQ